MLNPPHSAIRDLIHEKAQDTPGTGQNRMPKPLSVNLLIGPGAPAGLPALQRRRSTELTESTSALSHSTCFATLTKQGFSLQ
jgi:hypothetical protein